MCIRDSIQSGNNIFPVYRLNDRLFHVRLTVKISVLSAVSAHQGTVVAVSYTHLDVYKRQAVLRLLEPTSPTIGRSVAIVRHINHMPDVFLRLDVYKRQAVQ